MLNADDWPTATNKDSAFSRSLFLYLIPLPVFTYYERIGSGTHRNIMEVAYNYKSKFRFVITSYNDSLAYLHLPGVDLAKLPETKIMVLLCAEAE